MNKTPLKIAYFGGEPIGVPVLKQLEAAGILPSLIICNPDRPVGRKHELTPPPVKVWATEHDISVFQPETLKEKEQLSQLTEIEWDLFIVVAYGLIMPKWLIDMPKYKTLNVHPSLLPLLRGASPIRSAILQDMKQTGVTIMQMDEKMDHGPIVAQSTTSFTQPQWPIHGRELDAQLADLGGTLLAETIPKWVAGEIQTKAQDHTHATFSSKITKEMSELTINPRQLPTGSEAYEIFLKICAYDGWPGTFFIHSGKRVKIGEASLSTNGTLVMNTVIPEGKKECPFKTYLASI